MSFEIIEKIKKDIDEQAELEIEQIKFEMKMIHDDEIDSFKHNLIKETDLFLNTEMSKLKTEETTLKTRMDLEVKNKILSFRNALLEDIKKQLLDKLHRFVQSDEYFAFLETKVNSVKSGLIYARKEDFEFLRKLKPEFQIIEKEFKIGGFINIDGDTEYDYSLDSAYQNEIKNFINNSRFIV